MLIYDLNVYFHRNFVVVYIAISILLSIHEYVLQLRTKRRKYNYECFY